MSEPLPPRRQLPSPLVFSPESALAPVVAPSVSSGSGHGSGSNTVSMPFVRRHVTRRLKAAKQECDKELQRVTNSITFFFEERLREGELERELEREQRERERERDQQSPDPDPLREAFVLRQAEPKSSAFLSDDASSDSGYGAELEGNHSRHPSLSSSSPGVIRRQATISWDKVSGPSPASAPNSAAGSSQASEVITTSPRKQGASADNSWSSGGIASRRLSRSIHIPIRPTRSGHSSRSTSRSRSPLPPPNNHSSFTESLTNPGLANNRRSSRILIDNPVDPIMTNLYELIAVATDVVDMTVAQLTSQPKSVEAFVQRVQMIGKAWDDHPDWHGRNWYVQVLLAVASLSRVVEWWEAEKQFWNFDDNDDEQDEALLFVMKPAEDHIPPPAPTPRLAPEDDPRLRLSRPTSQGKRSREEIQSLSLAPPEPSRASSSKTLDTAESARVLATERLRLQAETAQNRNIVMELNLDGDHIMWLNYAWEVVVGTNPDELHGTRISRLLSPRDASVFQVATQTLREDDSHTVEVRFHLRIEPLDERDDPNSALYQPMEGKGMMMTDREEGTLAHTMWVIKYCGTPEYLQPAIHVEDGDTQSLTVPGPVEHSLETKAEEPSTPLPFARPINVTPILCRICENSVPQWYFEKHNETCSETHRLEAEIGECNESIAELRNTIRDISTALDRSSPVTTPEYRGLPILSPSSSPISSSPLQIFRINKMQRFGVKKMQRRLLEQLDETLQVALEISVPALKEDEAKEPIERQRLLSPGSERKITQIRNWSKPTASDSGLGQLVQDAERVMRQKIDTVVRLQNTIRYSEKVRQEWEERVALALEGAEDEEDDEEEEEEGPADESEYYEGNPQSDDDRSSTTSEYAYGRGGNGASPDPTPLASTPPIPAVATTDKSFPLISPFPQPLPPPVTYAWQGISLQTRSSTPSSVSSPLALAAPIVASDSPDDGNPPHMDLNDSITKTVRPRKSVQNLDASQQNSPLTSPLELPGARRSHRRHSTINPVLSPVLQPVSGPVSPRLPSATPLSRTTPTSIKDFEIIKPISKGAFGSVFLSRKKATGDYYAIKVLKKADMIAKNQITNVKAERMILMKQAESPFVAKLYFTFQSKDNLYLVMEYLNGGDCAALIKSLGALPEEWAKNYVAEVVLGLDYLHERGIIHRDLKPDNLLIDQHGHLKLTDFGLSRIGLLGRQTREAQLTPFERGGRAARTRYSPHSRPPSMDSAYLSSPLIPTDLIGGGSYFNQQPAPVHRQRTNSFLSSADDVSESSGSDTFPNFFARRAGSQMNDSPLQSFATELTTDLRSHSSPGGSGTPPGEQKFVGTPDYLAPETILGLRGDDAAVDWWALGVITYEFLYGAPPFHEETPEKVFENILSRRIEWLEEYIDYSPEARDLMERLLSVDPIRRLGANGAEEVKAHPWFTGIEWDQVTTTEAAFIPQVTDPESTDYFDPRGAILQLFEDDQPVPTTQSSLQHSAVGIDIPHSEAISVPRGGRDVSTTPADDEFGAFSFKNLPVLKQANDDVIRKLRTDQMAPITHTLSESGGVHTRKRSMSTKKKVPSSVITSFDGKSAMTNPPSPATSTSSIASSPSRGSVPPSTPGSVVGHIRKPSEFGAIERFKQSHIETDLSRRNSMPSRLRTASVSSSMGDGSLSDAWPASIGHASSHFEVNTSPSSVASIDLKRGPDPTDRAVTCLLAEDNPITAKIIETLLSRLGCRCVVVADGSEAIGVAMGDIKFDCILMDLHMPVVDGESAARYIKSTNNKNTSTPIIAVSAYSGADMGEASTLFAASLSKPLQKADLLAAMRELGFKTSTAHASALGKVKAITTR